MEAARRPYRLAARAEGMAATREKLLDAAVELFLARWYDEVTVAELARAAGVSPQTLVNHFGTKAGLLLTAVDERFSPEIVARRYAAEPGDLPSAVAALEDDYERVGDAVVRSLALEQRVPELAPVLALGRANHAEWVAHVFGPQLAPLPPTARAEREVLLSTALDVLVWKALRRDRGLSRPAVRRALEALAAGLLPPEKERPA